MNKKVSVSLIISTYNWPEALNLCLLSVSQLNVLPDEVIIADDGSSYETTLLIKRHQKNFPVPLVHVWQEDEGFQLSRIRNKAIAKAQCDYIIQIDGDLILHPSFVKDHIDISRKNTFVSGSRVLLNASLSNVMLTNLDTSVNVLGGGITNLLNGLRIPFVRNYLFKNYRVNDVNTVRGCNMAFWKEDLIGVNGYNESMHGWGKEDNEIAIRLVKKGLQKRTIKFGGIVFHIHHSEYSRKHVKQNVQHMEYALRSNFSYCIKGLSQYL